MLIISDLMNPSLSKVVGLLYRDAGVPQSQPGHWTIPSECATDLAMLEEAASRLSTTSVAPEDRDAAEAIADGEAMRYLDTEMAAFALGQEDISREIAARIPNGEDLLRMVSCVNDFLHDRMEVAGGRRDLCLWK